MIIGIDPGHGGQDPGAIGPSGRREKDINLAIALKVQYLLGKMGLKTVMSRNEDSFVSLSARTDLFNVNKVDYAVSIHCNASPDPAPDYVATYIQAPGGLAEKLAEKVQNRLVVATAWKDGGVRTQNLHITRETRMPAILCECGFISNPVQEAVLNNSEGQARIAKAIAAGVGEFLNIASHDEAAQPAEKWKQDIINKALQAGLITSVHDPDETASKWFVLQVVLNARDLFTKSQ